jgi:chromosome partitioning protein
LLRFAVTPVETVTDLRSIVKPFVDDVIAGDGRILSGQLRSLRESLFPPASKKTLRKFTSGEAAKLIGVTDGYLRQLSLAGEGPLPEIGAGGRRLYELSQVNDLRVVLDKSRPAKGFVKYRAAGEHLQVIAVTNFKGGSGKTTTAAHLAQFLALRGYRVLAVDLDPQASLTALHGLQPEFDVGPNATIYGAIRYDASIRDLADIIRPTYFDGVDLVPGNLELMEFEHDTPRALMDKKEGPLFFGRIARALGSVQVNYDVVVIDCPPQLGFLTLGALCAATGLIITVHPQMLDVMSMCQFLLMTSDLLKVVREAGGSLDYDFIRYLVTRYEPSDGPQTKITGFMRSMFQDRVLTHPMVKSTAIADAGLSKQTLYEMGREFFTRSTYDRAVEALDAVNGEIEGLIREAWGRA